MTSAEKRKFARFEIERETAVLNTEDGTFFGHLENLSMEGMMLCSESSHTVGQEYAVNFSVQTEAEGQSTISCRVCVMWSGENMWRESEPTKQHCTGFKITDISATELKTLEAYIKALGSLV